MIWEQLPAVSAVGPLNSIVTAGDLLTDDCNDANDQVYPGAPEVCNGIADGCGGTPDIGTMVTKAECSALLDIYTYTD